MEDGDFEWAAELMERRRAFYEQFSPVFWRPGLHPRRAGLAAAGFDNVSEFFEGQVAVAA